MTTYFYLMAINKLGGGFDFKELSEFRVKIYGTKEKSRSIKKVFYTNDDFRIIYWNKNIKWDKSLGEAPLWFTMRDSSLAILAHELQHATDHMNGATSEYEHKELSEKNAIRTGNKIRGALFDLAERHYTSGGLWTKENYMRPGEYQEGVDPPLPWIE